MVISTARRSDLFADLLRTMRPSLSHDQIAELLVSEELNIFAVARYLRQTADAAVRLPATSLGKTIAAYPKIDPKAYGRPSAQWPPDNIKVLGSEYASRPWDDRITGWGEFVCEAYVGLKAAGL